MNVELELSHARRMRMHNLLAARTRKANGSDPKPAVYAAKYWHREVLRAKGLQLRGYVWI